MNSTNKKFGSVSVGENSQIEIVSDKPDMLSVYNAYNSDWGNHSNYRNKCIDSENQRNRWWPGKSPDLKKKGVAAKPWPNASDTEVPVIEPRINTLVSLCMTALRLGRVQAVPIGGNDVQRAAEASNFMRYAIDSWVPQFYRNMNISCNHFFEKGLAVTFVGWEGKKLKQMRRFTLEQLEVTGNFIDALEAVDEESAGDAEIGGDDQPNPLSVEPIIGDEGDGSGSEVVAMLTDPDRENEAVNSLMDQFSGLSRKRARMAVQSLRETGEAIIPVDVPTRSNPVVRAMSPDVDVIFPLYTFDTQKVGRVHTRHLMTSQEIQRCAAYEGWDSKWVQYVLKHCRGNIRDGMVAGDSTNAAGIGNYWTSQGQTIGDLYEIVRTYVRQFDDSDGSEGIYEIVWCPAQGNFDGTNYAMAGNCPDYGLYSLMSGYSEYPIVVSELSLKSALIYDTDTVPDQLRGNQRQAKTTRDSFSDNLSININPPMMHPPGDSLSKWGPGAMIPVRTSVANSYGPFETKDMSRNGVYVEQYLDSEADFISGLRDNSQTDIVRRQEVVNLFMAHVSKVCRAIYHAYQLSGEDEVFYRVNDTQEALTFSKSPEEEEMDIRIEFDIRLLDQEFVQETVDNLTKLAQMDTDGAINRRKMMNILTWLTAPTFASSILQPEAESQENIIRKVSQDLALIASGQSVGAQPSGATIALQYIQQYISQPDMAQKIAADQGWSERLGIYIRQYEQQLIQQQNAVTGRLGTAPAMLQGINTTE